MKATFPISFRAFLPLGLGLLLLVGLYVTMSGQIQHAHAASTITVSTCDESHLDTAINQANTDNAGDIVNFSCSGDITLTSTLSISGNMTVDGSGQQVTFDGQNQVQVLLVNSNVSNFTLNALTIAHGLNTASIATGGGLENNFGTVTITNSTFANNASGTNSAPNAYGGGIFNSGTMNVSTSTFTGNTASYGAALTNTGSVTITNSTFVGNTAAFNGGGIWTNSTVNVASSTIAKNTATSGNGGGVYNGGTVNSNDSIVANNTAFMGNNCFNPLTDNGYNLESGTDCGFTGTGSQQNTNPQLAAALGNNGGPTQTLALLASSPAIDVIPLLQCPSTDQRGDARPDAASPAETTCDIGAYESNNAPLTVSGTSVSATEGHTFSGVVATGTYSGTGTLTATITWGDGTANSAGTVNLNTNGSYSVSGSHTYTEEGQYMLTIMVSDGSQSAQANSSATVSDAALILKQFAAGSLGHRTAGLAALFTDADPAGRVSDYTATISWGDGTHSTVKVMKNPQGKGFVLADLHTYAKKGMYSVTLTVTDQGGSQLTKTVSATVK